MPNDLDNWKTALGGAGAALLAAWGWIFASTHRKIDGKATKESVDRLEGTVSAHTITKESFEQHCKSDERLFEAIVEEAKLQRGHIAKIFDQMKDSEEKSRNRHDATMTAIYNATRNSGSD
ncbi:MAG TPA: hypothetical protein VNA25_29190 [Phycisphaerae bacterium]|nr:hypothetical protein [Phycisphaerae bacterium]